MLAILKNTRDATAEARDILKTVGNVWDRRTPAS